MIMYILFFCLAVAVSLVSAHAVRRFARSRGIVDRPGSAPDRKQHEAATPLLGGWPIALSVIVTLGISLFFTGLLTESFLSTRQLLGMGLAMLILVIGGSVDDVKNLSPIKQILWPFVASFFLVAFGIGVDFITNPFGGVIELNTINIPVFSVEGIQYHVTLWSDLFTILWMMMVMYATKLLDGLDGLASGVGTIAAVILFALSMSDAVNQPGTALFASVIAGAFFGFWLLNRHPAKLFLGEGGSLLIGFLLGLLAIISGAKIATAILILALPLLDVAWVILARLSRGKRVFQADRLHLHFRLLDAGVPYNRVVSIFYSLSAVFGIAALVSSTKIKAILLVFAVLCSAVLVLFAWRKQQLHA